ncbi:MAG TPA: hypothetical protein VFF81_07920 [Noviherbaspirillum sp.]|nr:hypothetical protein [Noviherbaspirillum sp.]
MDGYASADIGLLRSRWLALVQPLAKESTSPVAVIDALVRHYSEPHRAYHNLSHIATLLVLADDLRSHFTHPAVVELAIWFHDVIYDTRASDNEPRSAAFARDSMRAMQFGEDVITSVEQCILATQRHEVPSQAVPDLPLFLDLDLSILGVPERAYRCYSQAIRKEYCWVPDDEYRVGRAAVLKRFLARPRLFFTNLMADRYEEAARHNIALELRELGQE